MGLIQFRNWNRLFKINGIDKFGNKVCYKTNLHPQIHLSFNFFNSEIFLL